MMLLIAVRRGRHHRSHPTAGNASLPATAVCFQASKRPQYHCSRTYERAQPGGNNVTGGPGQAHPADRPATERTGGTVSGAARRRMSLCSGSLATYPRLEAAHG
jgi:hypothetical protein